MHCNSNGEYRHPTDPAPVTFAVHTARGREFAVLVPLLAGLAEDFRLKPVLREAKKGCVQLRQPT